MIAMMIKKGTKHDCNVNSESGHIIWPINYRTAPFMIAIIFMMETKYASDLKSKTNYFCLQSVSIGTKYDCNHRIWISDIRP